MYTKPELGLFSKDLGLLPFKPSETHGRDFNLAYPVFKVEEKQNVKRRMHGYI